MQKRKYKEVICKQCGEIFLARVDKTTKYCSKTCFHESLKKPLSICTICGRKFKGRKNQEFCSNKCSSISKSQQILLKCDFCGKEFYRVKCHISPKNYCSTKCRYASQVQRTGNNAPRWNGGVHLSDGYILLRQDNGKYIGEHRIVMQNHIRRKLKSGEIVHHKDGNKQNNDISNLCIVSRSEHVNIHRSDLKSALEKLKVKQDAKG